MKNIKIWNLILLLFIIIINVNKLIAQSDTNYVKPGDLEYGWDLLDFFNIEPMPLKSYVSEICVTNDNRYLAYNDLNGIEIYDLINKNKFNTILDYPIKKQWGPDNKTLRLIYSDYIVYYDVNNLFIDTVYRKSDSTLLSYGLVWASDNYAYFSYPNGSPSPDSSVYRENIKLSMQNKIPINEKMPNIKHYNPIFPFFPPYNINYYAFPNDKYPGYSAIGYIRIVRNFDFASESLITLVPKNNDWDFSYFLTNIDGYWRPFDVGPNGDIYLYLSFRTLNEIQHIVSDPFDSLNKAARDASGWYRIDTSGKNLVQLVRCWVVYNGGIAVTGDGETIYYCCLLSDTTSAIMKMNKYGKNKELVLKIEPQGTDVKENTNDIVSINIFPNPANTDFIKLKVNDDNLNCLITYKIYSIEGIELIKGNFDAINNNTKTIELNKLPPGSYIIELNCNNKLFVKKFVKLK